MRQILSGLVILILLPYVIAVFVQGEGVFFSGAVSSSKTNLVEVGTVEEHAPIDWTEYLVGVTAGELEEWNEKMEPEFLRAQAVIARTRAIKSGKKDAHGKMIYGEPFLNFEEVKKIRMGGQSIENAITDAVLATDEEVLVYQDTLPELFYFLRSNGRTRSGNEVFGAETYPYLAKVECEPDQTQVGQTTAHLYTYTQIKQYCKEYLYTQSKDLTFSDMEILERDSSGYVTKVRVGEKEISGELFKELCHLTSSDFHFQNYYGKLRILCTGCGHGIGLSQYTAYVWAKEGKNHSEILLTFFPNCNIEKRNKIFEKTE